MSNELVAGGDASGGVPNGTPAGGGVPNGTPALSAADAAQEWQRKLEAERMKWETDLNRMKSSLQSQIAQTQADYRQREAAYNQRIRELEVAGLDETEREKYERVRLQQDFQAMQRDYQQLQQQLESERQRQAYVTAFANMGVNPAQLDSTSPETVIASGWAAVQARMRELEAKSQTPASAAPNSPATDLTPPTVNVNSGNLPSGNPSWPDLIQKYGSMEKVFSLVEQQQLPVSVIPLT